MEAVTAAKIQIVYEKLFNLGKPWKLMASATKNPVRKGPVSVSLPVKYRIRKIPRQINEKAIKNLEMILFLAIYVYKFYKVSENYGFPFKSV
jgi:hypothetical protein